MPFFSTWLDPRCCSGPDLPDRPAGSGAGLLYTILDNPRDCVVTPALDRPGITQWLGGQPITPQDPLHLRPGLYPYLVRVEPAFYAADGVGERPPIPGAAATQQAERRFLIAPAFAEVPHPAARLQRWLDRAKARLQAVVRDLPGSDEAKAAAAILAETDAS